VARAGRDIEAIPRAELEIALVGVEDDPAR
jgi:hypothetical protein